MQLTAKKSCLRAKYLFPRSGSFRFLHPLCKTILIEQMFARVSVRELPLIRKREPGRVQIVPCSLARDSCRGRLTKWKRCKQSFMTLSSSSSPLRTPALSECAGCQTEHQENLVGIKETCTSHLAKVLPAQSTQGWLYSCMQHL